MDMRADTPILMLFQYLPIKWYTIFMATFYTLPPNTAGRFIVNVPPIVIEPALLPSGNYGINIIHLDLFPSPLKEELAACPTELVLLFDGEEDGTWVLLNSDEITDEMLDTRVGSAARNLKSNDNSQIIFKYGGYHPILYWGKTQFNKAQLKEFLINTPEWSNAFSRMGGDQTA